MRERGDEAVSHVLRMFLLIGIFCYFIVIFYFLKRQALNLKYTLLWIITGAVMLLVAIFPSSMDWAAGIFGISSPVNAVFALELFFQMLILMSITAIVSKQNKKNKRLIQEMALFDKRIRDLNKKTKGRALGGQSTSLFQERL